ncbi:hypothetical protein A3A79_05170 [Candidatus Gottesmanbacteria bacterium RIFCSPLOWO2_01_FULL_43_11b]|uniref:Uncharacterized protein n=1 Tax=Candidatus Gottesmanbacteria bacterium RIFCSPLOWO2_01_FULL_43_11b TaxID=1798392 RepID=A0A1F6AIT6_9BACT|nr:MAG: hypothetical protein A3A79_05170 [Candidatus Gottesmanbacteria bacterium RIFCSPLOWO2_01_FULL_43_11b]
MNKKLLYAILGILLVISGFVIFKAITSKPAEVVEEEPVEVLPEVDASVIVDVTKSRSKDNSVVLSIDGLGGKYTSITYEISYDTQGVVQGVTSQPLNISGKDSFTREDIYLGTCSRNVCRPHLGVKKVSVVIQFTDTSGSRSRFSKDFDL